MTTNGNGRTARAAQVPTPTEINVRGNGFRRPRRSKYDALMRDIFMRLEQTGKGRGLSYELTDERDVYRTTQAIYKRLNSLGLSGALTLYSRDHTMIVAHGENYHQLPPRIADLFGDH